MKQYEILEHTADLKIRAFGKTKEELFANMLLGMQDCMKAKLRPQEKVSRVIKTKSPDLSALLVDFLSEVLYLTQVNKEIYNDIKFKKFEDTPHQDKSGTGQAELEGELLGQKVERFGEDIKGVTYHGLDIKKVDDHWEAIVLFDI